MQRLIEAGEITAEEAEQSDRRNIILQALGPEARIRIDLTHQQVRRGDTLVLCSDGLSGMVLPELQADYVETFDTRRRTNLFLTYFAHGDTRKRGMALLRFKQTYLASGFELTDTELPDHLCVVLEYAATIDRERGRQLILDHRAGLELLRISLADSGSRWAGAVEAITATLPPLQGDEWEAVLHVFKLQQGWPRASGLGR